MRTEIIGESRQPVHLRDEHIDRKADAESAAQLGQTIAQAIGSQGSGTGVRCGKQRERDREHGAVDRRARTVTAQQREKAGPLGSVNDRIASEATTQVEPHRSANWMIDLVSSSMNPAPRKKKCQPKVVFEPHRTPRTATTDTTRTSASAQR